MLIDRMPAHAAEADADSRRFLKDGAFGLALIRQMDAEWLRRRYRSLEGANEETTCPS